MRELTHVVGAKKENCFIIGKFKPKVQENGEPGWIADGRVIHFNQNGYTMYLGFMQAGMRHGWGLEIPIRSEHLRDKFRETNFKYGKRIIPRDNDDAWIKHDK